MSEILFKDQSYRISGACFEVYTEKAAGFWNRCITRDTPTIHTMSSDFSALFTFASFRVFRG